MASVLALASGEESSESEARAQKTPCRRRTAASVEDDILTTPCRNPTWLHQGGKHAGCSSSASRAAQIARRCYRSMAASDRQPRCLEIQTGGFASPPCGRFALGLADSRRRLERERNVSR